MGTGTKNKKTYLELLRIICAGLVIFNHIPGYTLYQTIGGSSRFLCMFLTMLTRINVPIFFMISGTLLLGRQEDYRTVLKKRVTRVMILIAFAEIAYYFCNLYKLNRIQNKPTPFDVGFLVRGVFSGAAGPTAYWYFYAYLGFVLMLPLLRRIAQGLNKQDFFVLLSLHFLISSFLPILNLVLSMFNIEGFTLYSKFEVVLATKSALFYPLIGYYIDQKVDVSALSAKFLRLLSILALIGIAVSCACTDYQGITEGKYTQDYVMLFDYITAIAVFLMIKRLLLVGAPAISKGRIGQVLCFFGSLTLGIYMFDPILRVLLLKYSSFSKHELSTLGTSFVWIVKSMAIGGCLTFLLRLIPGVKKIL